jgi:predicted transglutaminase-like protease
MALPGVIPCAVDDRSPPFAIAQTCKQLSTLTRKLVFVYKVYFVFWEKNTARHFDAKANEPLLDEGWLNHCDYTKHHGLATIM